MSAVPKKLYTAEEYEARERVAEFKSEFYRGEIFPMEGPVGDFGLTFHHSRIKANLVVEIGARIKGTRFQTLSSAMRIKVAATGLQTYPDVLILCGLPRFADRDEYCLSNPSVIIEVLSEPTAGRDLGVKFRSYREIESLAEIVFVESDQLICTRYVRASDRRTWIYTCAEGFDGSLMIVTVDVTIPLRDICAGVEFSEPAGPGE